MSDPTPIAPPPPPRAFAQGVGLLLQGVGVVLFLLSTCVCFTTFLWDPLEADRPAATNAATDDSGQAQPARGLQRPAQAGVLLVVIAMSVGGLAMASFGLGLQADRARAASGALASTAMTAAALVAGSALLWTDRASWLARLASAPMTLAALILTGFCVAAWRQVRRSPPPADVDTVPPGTKLPYSFYHQDPPEVRLANEIVRKRAAMRSQQQELERMERELRDKERK